MAVTLEDIKAGLAELGLAAGDVVLVHSDLRRLDKARDLVKLPNCGADTDASAPPNEPIGVRRALTMTTSFSAIR